MLRAHRMMLPRLAVILGGGLLVLAGCRCHVSPPPAKPVASEACKPSAVAAPSDWTLQFTDSFKRADLGTDWAVVAGEEGAGWSIADGALSGSGTIMCARKFPGSQRLEFDATTGHPCDLTGLLGSNATGVTSGYFFGFGSENNTFSQLMVRGVQVKKYDALITPGKVHHIVCERDGATLKHTIDGNVVMTYTDPSPLVGHDNQMVGFYIYTSGKISNVKVYTKPEKAAGG